MKRHGMLNSHIAEVLASLGHTDTIVIADCGLPIPDGVRRIDISLKQGSPSFLETLDAVVADMAIETVTIATEIKEANPNVFAKIQETFTNEEMQLVSHEEFKEQCKRAKAVIRTGEVTPYANIILHAGVIF